MGDLNDCYNITEGSRLIDWLCRAAATENER